MNFRKFNKRAEEVKSQRNNANKLILFRKRNPLASDTHSRSVAHNKSGIASFDHPSIQQFCEKESEYIYCVVFDVWFEVI